ncbi:asparagine-linked glycosylation protein [Dimargaris xerosporica]|nr:asparagine-linked glycosylation protein [Dimargaris xerosporica]
MADTHPLVVATAYVLLSLVPLGYVALSYWRFQLRESTRQFCQRHSTSAKPAVVGFFHPYCNAGGGGERVLWTAIHCMQIRYPNAQFVVYTGDTNATKDTILSRATNQFSITVQANRIEMVFLQQRHLVSDTQYPRWTLLGQSLGSIWLGLEALGNVVPDVFIDTMGYAFTYPLVKLLAPNTPIITYTHYPTISTDMIQRIPYQSNVLTNSLKSTAYTWGKTAYYKLFAWLYGWVGAFADCVMVNSSWTKNHIDQLWHAADRSQLVYPPCDTEAFITAPLENRQRQIVSVAQFRPEKNHQLQLEALYHYLQRFPDHTANTRLVLVGSSRNQDDEQRISQLRDLAHSLDLDDNVKFAVNASFSQLKAHLANSLIGLHTMRDEHFGIGIIEYMAAGLIPIAHNSGGPKMDIVHPDPNAVKTATPPGTTASTHPPNGCLASTKSEYAECLHYCLDSLATADQQAMQRRARQSARSRFSQQQFEQLWLHAVDPIVSLIG